MKFTVNADAIRGIGNNTLSMNKCTLTSNLIENIVSKDNMNNLNRSRSGNLHLEGNNSNVYPGEFIAR